MRLQTRNGHDFYECASLLQKSLRRGDIVYAARACDELLPRYANYVWNRLFVVSAEDCAELVTQEVMACYLAWCKLNEDRNARTPGGTRPERWPGQGWQKPGSRVFFMKAVVLLAKCKHSRDADELGLLCSTRLPATEFKRALRECESAWDDEEWWDMPEWSMDVHTRAGKRAGLTKADFIRAEHDALVNSTSIFRNFDEMAKGQRYVQPEFDW